MPAECEPHDAAWLSWPHDPASFPFLEKAEEAFATFIAEIYLSDWVELLVRDEPMQERASAIKSR